MERVTINLEKIIHIKENEEEKIIHLYLVDKVCLTFINKNYDNLIEAKKNLFLDNWKKMKGSLSFNYEK